MNSPSNSQQPATLRRQLGLATATSVVVANMVGAGIFTTTGLILAGLGSGWVVMLCWLLGGVIALCGALCYAELATMMPRAGGEYVYLGEIYGPQAAFLTGWISFFAGFSAPIAASAVACAAYLASAGALPKGRFAERATALAIVALFTMLHYRGVQLGARVQNALTGLKVLLLVGLVAVGFLRGSGHWDHFARQGGFWEAGQWSQVGFGMLLVMFAYSGWNASAYLAEEIRQPEKNLPRSLLLGTIIVMVIYLAVNLLFFFAAPARELSGVTTVGDVAVRGLFGVKAASIFSAAIGLLLLSSLSAYLLIGPRVYYAMAREGLFFRAAGRVHPRFETPGLAIMAQGLCAMVLALTGTFEQLLTYIGFALGIFPIMAVAGLILLRRREPQLERPYRVWGYPLVPSVYLAGSMGILLVAFLNRPWPSLSALLTLAAGVPVYRMIVRQIAKRAEPTVER